MGICSSASSKSKVDDLKTLRKQQKPSKEKRSLSKNKFKRRNKSPQAQGDNPKTSRSKSKRRQNREEIISEEDEGESSNGENTNIQKLLVAQLEDQKTQNKLMMQMIEQLKKNQEMTHQLLSQPKLQKSTPLSHSKLNQRDKSEFKNSEISLESQLKGIKLSKKKSKDRLGIKFSLVKANLNTKSFQGLPNRFTPPLRLDKQSMQGLNRVRSTRDARAPNYLSLNKRGSNTTLGRPVTQINRTHDRLKTVKKSPMLIEQRNQDGEGDSQVGPLLFQDLENSEILSSSDSSSDFQETNYKKIEEEEKAFMKQRSTLKSNLLFEYVDTVMEENEETPKNTPDSESHSSF